MNRLLFILILAFGFSANAQLIHKRKVSLLGSPFEITVVANDTTKANQYEDMAIAEVKRIENLISDWIPTTPLSQINQNAGKQAVKVPLELIELIERSIKIAKLTDGAFDISYASMDRIWKFDGSMKEMPSPEAIKKSVEKVGFENIIIDKEQQTVFLKLEGMKLGMGGIGQGYIADKVKAHLMANGCSAGLVNISGDISTWGKQPNGEQWKVGIKNPMNKNKIFATFPLEDTAVETSGSYEKYVTFNGKRYSHIIDTRTGYPATGLISVSIFAKTTELADALATGVFVMGKDAGMNLVNQLPGIGCIMVDEDGKISTSNNIDLKKYQHD
jgi:thiamine biosynthesis lipoprotein